MHTVPLLFDFCGVPNMEEMEIITYHTKRNVLYKSENLGKTQHISTISDMPAKQMN